MRNLELVDYLDDIRAKYENLGESNGFTSDEFITAEHNKTTTASMSKTGQYEYYCKHKKYGKDFVNIVNDINGFVSKYPNLIHELFTTNETSSGFGYVLATSDDEKEAHEWKERFSGVEGDVQIPISKNALHATNSVHIITNPNWRKLEDPERRIDGLFGIYDGNKYYGVDNQSSMDVLNAYLSKKKLMFTSHPDLGLEESVQINSGEYYVEDEYYSYRVGSFIKYPVLHPRVKTYLGLLKKFFGTVLKIEEIKYNAIDIIPINGVDISVYVATNVADDINSHFNVISSIKNDVNFMNGNIMSRIASAYNFLEFQNDYNEAGEYVSEIDEDKMSNDSLYFSFYKRDRELRFQSLMSARLDRINESILSLNKLHNPTNYKFEKEDFDSAYKSIKESLSNFESNYNELKK